eukprot:TRINITY_DN15761_c0_g1_i1.p1 TRINITY_DN15761_c0_g1~~TRINITY_DN15761_c0_g1_i1.p1  ORF type:complete len:216 (-),score=60.06 TRINITY_DN15761_c0_g1_i1:78-665(-)
MSVRCGYPAPDFDTLAVIGQDFKKIKLSDYKGKWVYLFFYPLDFTFVCPTEILAFNDRAAEFAKLNCEVIGASVDSEYTHLAWINTPRKQGGIGGVTIPLIADLTKEVSQKYGALYQETGHTLRASFLIGPDGIVRHMVFNEPPVGRSVDETLRLLQAFQFADEHGDVCPANWKPGDDTMKADPVKSATYFNKHN